MSGILAAAREATSTEVVLHLNATDRLCLRVRRLAPTEALNHGFLLQTLVTLARQASQSAAEEPDELDEAEADASDPAERAERAREYLASAQGLARSVVTGARLNEGAWKPGRVVLDGEEGEDEQEVRLPLSLLSGADLEWIVVAALAPSREVADRLRPFRRGQGGAEARG